MPFAKQTVISARPNPDGTFPQPVVPSEPKPAESEQPAPIGSVAKAIEKHNSAQREEAAQQAVTRESLLEELAVLVIKGGDDEDDVERLSELMAMLNLTSDWVQRQAAAVDEARRLMKLSADNDEAMADRRNAELQFRIDVFIADRESRYEKPHRLEATNYSDQCSTAAKELALLAGNMPNFFEDGVLRGTDLEEIAAEARQARLVAATKNQLSRCEAEIFQCEAMLSKESAANNHDGFREWKRLRTAEKKKLSSTLEKLTSQSA